MSAHGPRSWCPPRGSAGPADRSRWPAPPRSPDKCYAAALEVGDERPPRLYKPRPGRPRVILPARHHPERVRTEIGEVEIAAAARSGPAPSPQMCASTSAASPEFTRPSFPVYAREMTTGRHHRAPAEV